MPTTTGAASSSPTSVGMVVNAFGAVVFAIMMSVFWWFIASEELRAVVQSKSEVLHTMRHEMQNSQSLRDGAVLLDAAMVRLDRRSRDVAAAQAQARRRLNLRLWWTFIAPFVVTGVGLMLGFIAYNRVMTRRGRPHEFVFGHWCGMVAVLFGYVTEVLFFLFVVHRYVMMGDWGIARRVTVPPPPSSSSS